jgi:hypothetical protein
MITIDQDFSVDERTLEFSEGYLSLELMLSDPITGKLRSVQKHRMQMQISGVYSLSPNPSYLLVVNSKTPNHAIHQIIVLLGERLHTHLLTQQEIPQPRSSTKIFPCAASSPFLI